MRTTPDRSVHRLQNGDLLLEVCPQLGGSIVRWSMHRDGKTTELLRPGSSEKLKPVDAINVLDTSSFPLVPYSGRITNAEFNFLDRHIRQPTLDQFHPHAIHGHGWLHAWQLIDETEQSLVLEYRNDGDTPANQWPWSYCVQQRFTLTRQQLSVDLEIHNESTDTMPAGLGLHPYFPVHDGAIIKTASTGIWLTDDLVLPVEHQTLGREHAYNLAFSPTDHQLDNVFTGWNGRARLEWSKQNLALDIQSNADHLIIFTPPGEDYFCVEPATHAADSFNDVSDLSEHNSNSSSQNAIAPSNRLGTTTTGRQTIEAGDSLSLAVEFIVGALNQ